MKLAIANAVRARYINQIMEYLAAQGEDVALVTSNSCNLPIVEDGEEGVLEIVVKVVKKPYDECMQEREDYQMKLQEQAERKAEREREAAADPKQAAADKATEERHRRFLLGKKAARTIKMDNGIVIVEAGADITEEVLQKAKLANKFIELSMNVQ